MLSVLGRGSFSTNSSISEVWHGSDQPVALLRHYWAYCWIDCFSSFSWKYPIDSRRGSGMLSGQSSTVISWSASHLEVILSQWAGAKVLLENEISISIKLVSRWKHKVLQNVLVDGCVDFGLQKTQWVITSRWHCSPNHHRLWKLHTGSVFLQTLGPWYPNEMQHLLSSEKRTLDLWATVQFFFSLAQVRCFWQCFWFRSGLVALFLKMSERGDSWCTDSIYIYIYIYI